MWVSSNGQVPKDTFSIYPNSLSSDLGIKKDAIPSFSKSDRWICLNTALHGVMTIGLNAILKSQCMDPYPKRRAAARCVYLIIQMNKIWKQSLVSQILPSDTRKSFRWIASPLGAAVAIGLSYWTDNRIFEIPMSLLSTYFIAANAYSKMSRNEPAWKFLIHLFNASGAAISTLDTLGMIQLIDPGNWGKTIRPPTAWIY